MGSSSNYPKGVSAAEEALPLFQQVGDEAAIVEVLISLADGASYSGNSERARAAAEEGVAKARVLCD